MAGVLGPLTAKDIQITASVDRNPVGVGEQFVYQVEVTGATQSLPEPALPDLSAFTVISGPNVSTSFQIVNGAVSSSKTFSFVLLPRREGKFRLGPATVEYKGRTYRSNDIVLIVTKESPRVRQRQKGNRRTAAPRLFLKVTPTRKTVYVNQQVDVSYKVYFRGNVRNFDYVKLPETVGFWVEEYKIPQNIPISQEIVNGVAYNVAEVKKMALFPSRPGELTVSPLQVRLDVVEQRRRRDPFDLGDFFDSPFGRTVRRVLTSDPVTIVAKPLPEQGRPANFSGLVGSFRMFSEIDKTEVPANEAISLKIRITGSGNIKSLKELPINFPASFEVFDPKVVDTINREQGRLTASRDLEYVVIPRSPGEYRIPPLEIAYFDPAVEQYRILRTPEYRIHVTEPKGAGTLAGGYIPRSEVTLLGKDIHFIKEDRLSLKPIGRQPYQSTWFMVAMILPLLMVGVAYGLRNYQEKMATNVEYARKRKAFGQARRRLKAARQLLKQQKLAEFYGEVSRSLIGFVADKTNRPAAGLLREDVEKLLRRQGVDEPLIQEYLKYLDEADFRRFAPAQADTATAQQFYQGAEEVLVKLGKYL
ncbi:MAG: protein BatD [Calditrichaeota bacterium]|nr:MAG: protein BatD [Calditrichota bacterium]